MTFKKSLTVALATLATAAAVQAQYSPAPPAPTEPISPPHSGAVVDQTQPASPTMTHPALPPSSADTQPSSTGSTTMWVPDDSQRAKTREEVKQEVLQARRDGTLGDANGQRTIVLESPLLTPEY